MKSTIIPLILLALIAAAPAVAGEGEGGQPSTKQRIKTDAKEVGHAIKKGAIETGHAIKKGAKEAWSGTRTAVHNATHDGAKDTERH